MELFPIRRKMQIEVKRRGLKFKPDFSRVIARFFYMNDDRALGIIKAVLEMREDEVRMVLNQVLRDFSMRHRNCSRIFQRHYENVRHLLPRLGVSGEEISSERQLIIGSYFTLEYSIEAAAIFNPSIVEHPDQSEIAQGEKRVILSFRATGEGHLSSIVFRTGVLDKEGNLTIEPIGKFVEEAEYIRRHVYDKEAFKRKLEEMECSSLIPSDVVLNKLGERFTYGELKKVIVEVAASPHLVTEKKLLLDQISWLASSHYELQFSLDTNISERVIFPVSYNEKNGIEDARFVKFTDDDGSVTYYATYTAYDGISILPKLLSTKDFYHFKVMPIHGEVAQNKGMALFPRKIRGKYAMLCRMDGINNYIAYSDDITVWREAKLMQKVKYPWELVQVGNCGSPIETPDGWLVITHGVGPMREYSIGASLFDLENPEIEIGRLSSPLLVPNIEEREGYVPNVVYSCGSIVYNGYLVIPYAMSDYASTYATVDLKELLRILRDSEE